MLYSYASQCIHVSLWLHTNEMVSDCLNSHALDQPNALVAVEVYENKKKQRILFDPKIFHKTIFQRVEKNVFSTCCCCVWFCWGCCCDVDWVVCNCCVEFGLAGCAFACAGIVLPCMDK